MPTSKQSAATTVSGDAERLIRLSEQLHAHPETGWEEHNSSRWVAEFVGDINLFEGQVEPREAMARRLTVTTRDAGTVYVAEPRQPVTRTTVSVAIRPEKIKLSRRGPASDAVNSQAINRLEGVVTDVGYLGGLSALQIISNGTDR